MIPPADRPVRLEQLLAVHAAQRGEHVAIVCGRERVRYAALHARVRAVASGLARLGVRAGDRVLIALPNGIPFIEFTYAAFTVGAVVVPVNVRLAAPEVAHIVRDARPSAAVYHDSGRTLIRGALDRSACQTLVVAETGVCEPGEIPAAALSAADPVELPAIPPDADDCIILYTSGTTGRAKGALNTHANMIVQNNTLLGERWGIDAQDRFLVTTPLAHRAGCARLFNALGLGGTLVVMERFDAMEALRLIEAERITVTGLPPTVLRMMLPELRKDASRAASLRRVIVSTEAFPPALREEVASLLPHVAFHTVFGMSEALVSNLDAAEQATHPGSVGRPFPGVAVRIVDEHDRDLPAGAVGEILVRGGAPGRDVVMKEYFARPDATAAAFLDGSYRTGDLGRLDADGYLYVVDRKKDMVISGGYNIYSKEVEQVLATHPAVAQAAVVGVPDPIFGEAVAAFVECRPGARATTDALIEHCRTALASYKKPKHVFFVDALPANSLGKVLKETLRRAARERLAEGQPAGESAVNRA